jgi:hypothetical protein
MSILIAVSVFLIGAFVILAVAFEYGRTVVPSFRDWFEAPDQQEYRQQLYSEYSLDGFMDHHEFEIRAMILEQLVGEYLDQYPLAGALYPSQFAH